MADLAGRELDAAGITGPTLRTAYLRCRALHARHGRTYFLATRLLAPAQRPAVHALYGFARYADEIVDALDDARPAAEKLAALDALEPALLAALHGTPALDPVLRAVAHTARRYELDPALFRAFLAAMRLDTHVTDYPTFEALAGYMHGSAAVIGLQMLPVLGTVGERADAEPSAAALGIAFQLTNFLRDVGEDLRRGRIYLPQDSLRQHGVDRERLQRGVVDGPIRRLLADEIARTRELYRSAEQGIRLLDPTSRPCVQ
ncbi:MAG TPA: phytoene/squalene synthase family protein, partial [Pseudonocardia sp.]|nr:phytoene/squalene synthase family protein [Pseudonocardia sp.]